MWWEEFFAWKGWALTGWSKSTRALSRPISWAVAQTCFRRFGDHVAPLRRLPEIVQKQRKVHYHSKWKTTQDAVYWVNLGRAQDKGFWKTRSNAVIVYNVFWQTVYKVISQKGERSLFERLSPPRPALKVVLQSAWQSQQQQQQQQYTSESASSRPRELGRRGGKRAERRSRQLDK